MKANGNFPPIAGNVVPPTKPRKNPRQILAGAVRPPKTPTTNRPLPPMAGKVLPPNKTNPSRKAVTIAVAVTTALAAIATAIIAKIKGGAEK